MGEPFKKPFSVVKINPVAYWIQDACGRTVPLHWLCDRLNAPTSADAASEREAFEQWASHAGVSIERNGEIYRSRETGIAYSAWVCSPLWGNGRTARTTPAAAEEWIVCKSCKGEGVHLGGPIRDAAGGTIDVMDDEDCRYCKGKGRLRLVDLAPYITGSSVVEGQARNYAYRESARDWTEDYPHENGRYLNHCRLCGAAFCGHKRRPTCRVCTPPAADAPQGGEGEREAFEARTKTQMPRLDLYRQKHFDTYGMPSTQSAWEAWQVRATKADAPALGLSEEPK
jgi:hypothetical protein